MNGQIPNPPNIIQTEQPPSESLAPSPVSPSETPKEKRAILFEILFVLIVLILVFGALNYFNILRLSDLFPNNLNKKETTPVRQSFPTFPPSLTDQAKQTLTSFLPTILSPSLLPKSNSEIKLTEDKKLKDNFNALWVTKEGVAGVNFDISSDSNKITSLAFRFQKIQPASPSVELAKTTTTELFYVNPKGAWTCTKISNRRSYCENFWEEQDAKKGLGFQIDSLSSESARFIFSYCEHSKESNLYTWKSCRSEFAESGVR